MSNASITTRVVINAAYGGFCLNDEVLTWLADNRCLHLEAHAEVSRHNEALVACVEALGTKAGTLEIVTIEGNTYLIEEYDGYENVLTPDRVKWVTA